MTDLEDGVFIQHTVEGILLNNDGKQLMAESVYLYGVMLLLLDEFIEGQVRERMLISYLRYKGQQEEPLLDEVCKLCKSTGYQKGQKKPPKYPEDFFQRFDF
jgi:WASH complex subunit strumpellin